MHVYKLVGKAANQQLPAKLTPCKAISHYRSHVTLRAGPDRGGEKEDLPEPRINLILNRILSNPLSLSNITPFLQVLR